MSETAVVFGKDTDAGGGAAGGGGDEDCGCHGSSGRWWKLGLVLVLCVIAAGLFLRARRKG